MALPRYVACTYCVFILKGDIKCNDDSGGRSVGGFCRRHCLKAPPVFAPSSAREEEEELLKLCEENRVLVIPDG